MMTDDFEHLDHANRDVGGDRDSHPTDAAAPAAVPTRRVGVIVCIVVAVLCSLIAAALDPHHEDDHDRWSRYQECISQEQARIAREGSLLQAHDFCDLYPGR